MVARNRLEAARARTDTRDWAKARRERTRHLIELGGLVTKAGLVELVDDDRATLLGAFLELAARMGGQEEERQGVSQADLLVRWRRAGLRAFAAEREATAKDMEGGQEGAETAAAPALPDARQPAP